MKKYSLLILIAIAFLADTAYAQKLTAEEKKLYEIIMEYRKENNLPVIPLSKSLTFVAQTHVRDLEQNQPSQGSCNSHSWSDKGDWTACCYTSDHKEAKCMWDKPRELTSYSGNGYEIAFWSSGGANAINSLNGWKRSSGHNAVVINEGIWQRHPWKAIGVGIFGDYSVVWFGEMSDEE